MEAQMIADLLKSEGLTAHVNGSKEYASIVSGNDLGRYEIMVPEDEVTQGIRILSEIDSGGRIPKGETLDKTPMGAKSLLKRAVVYAFMGAVVLPIVFNVVSAHYLYKYFKSENNTLLRTIWSGIVVFINIVGFAIAYTFYNSSWLTKLSGG